MTFSLFVVEMRLTAQVVRCVCLAIFIGGVLAADERYLLHRAVLDGDGRFVVQWGPGDEDDLVFKVEVMARGYVALGLSPNGGMTGSDVVTAWVRDGEVYLQDRYAEGLFMPRMDRGSQDWKLLSASENDTHTTVLFRRKLETCDADDRTIDSSTMRLIYAYSEADPLDVHNIPYHGSMRGGRSVMLLQPEMNRKPNIEGTSHWDVLSPNYTISSSHSSMYWCKIMKGPELSAKNHIVMIEPLIEEGHEGYVHHLVLYECVGGDADVYEEQVDTPGHECYHPNMPDAMFTCDGVFAAWGVGGESLVFPDHVGMPLDPSPPKYYMLEMHYDNPFKHDGITDQSGFRLHYTPKLRHYDAGSLMIGAAVSPRVIIPPGQAEYVVAGHSCTDCLSPVMLPEGIKMIGVFQHSHLLGRHLKTRHFRNGTELPPLADDSNYDFNYQEYLYFSEEIEFLPDDQITVECTYDSRKRNTTTFGGLSTQEEMCLSFILYYPRISRFGCVSVAPMQIVVQLVGGDELANLIGNDKTYEKFIEYVKPFDWSKTDIKSVEKGIQFADHNCYCYTGSEKSLVQGFISYPKDLKEYVVPPSCVEEQNQNFQEARKGSSLFIHDLQSKYFYLLLIITFIVW